MIAIEDYLNQLKTLYNSEQLRNWSQYRHASFLEESILIEVSPSTHITTEAQRHDHTIPYLQFKIIYNETYQEPMLLIRIFQEKHSIDDDIEDLTEVSPYFPTDICKFLFLDNQFQIGLDYIEPDTNGGVWYSIHPCDTGDIVGNNEDFKNSYMNRWFSVFVVNWLK